MLTADEAQELFAGLVELLEEERWQGRLAPIVSEVRVAIARGKPAGGEVSVAGKRKREVVRRIEPFGSVEQLEILVGALEFALVTPVDMASATVKALSNEEVPSVDLVFESDSAVALANEGSLPDPDSAATRTAPDRAVISTAQIDSAVDQVSQLRAAILAIRSELTQ